jgi:hypothetical protein
VTRTSLPAALGRSPSRWLAGGALLLLAPAALHAQVGSTPAASPFRDLEYRQELTAFTGWFVAGTDPARVAPRSGPMLGARYDVRIGGPAQFTARLATVFSERRIIDPSQAGDARLVAMREQGLYLGDVGITLNLTGQKSWRDLVPYTQFGVGLATDFRGRDASGYRFGTTFAFNFGGGVRWVPADRWQLRANVADWLYQIQYPETFYVPTTTGGDDAVLRGSQAKSVWTHNVALTIGASYLFFR